ncbi:unnamed protein product [Spirodela intermedia]|uniref:Uncharacterized protein n=1 Tax=Spirodela intermedia TaxID=51605 RepID=A0A7I8K964_SPIIN|nr:unnamed protein product [Spirodela intermedia]
MSFCFRCGAHCNCGRFMRGFDSSLTVSC